MIYYFSLEILEWKIVLSNMSSKVHVHSKNHVMHMFWVYKLTVQIFFVHFMLVSGRQALKISSFHHLNLNSKLKKYVLAYRSHWKL